MRKVGCIIMALALCLSLTLPALAAPKIIYSHATGSKTPRVALTFDDGPHPVYTPKILEILEEYGARATFFVVGSNADAHPELLKSAVAKGHEIGNHTYNHDHMAKLSEQEILDNIEQCSKTIERITGKAPSLFRPPEGVCNNEIKTVCYDKDLQIVLWSIDTRDWAHTPAAAICKNVRTNVKDGSIILMHDFTGKNSPTPEALRCIIPMLQELGYELVTVSELLQGTK